MKKYNLSEIMKAAWNLRKMSLKWVTSLSFGECLRRAWKAAKEAPVSSPASCAMSRSAEPWRTPSWWTSTWTP